MSDHQHTVMLLLVLIVLVRLVHNGRASRAWRALFGSIAAAPAKRQTGGGPPMRTSS